MPEGKKAAVPAPKPVREEDLYSAKTHLHQPVPVTFSNPNCPKRFGLMNRPRRSKLTL